ncbi:hypothetical protein ACWEQL_24085 [Kitasatospora sp. NPDC004240]
MNTTPVRTGGAPRRFVAAVTLAATLGACMSGPGTGKYDPLPVKSREEALDWARGLAAHLTLRAGIEANGEPERIDFNACVGRAGETAPDERYTLLYAIHGDVPLARHNEVIRAVRDTLTNQGLLIVSYREASAEKPYAAFSARHPASRYIASVDTTGDTRLALTVTTPCLLPPPADGPARS